MIPSTTRFSPILSAPLSEQREVKFSSETTTIDVKPLPPNAPPSFSGAVGHFALTTEVKPKTAQVGDPLTVNANISGRGNFDRVNAPALEDDKGWHTYPPSANFKADDDIGISGTKSFELVLTPNEPKKAVPPLIFSYFDPLKESYVTLKGDKMPVLVEGAPLTTYHTGARERGDHAASARRSTPAGAPGAGHSLSAERSRPLGTAFYSGLHGARLLGRAGGARSWA
jgi:hypothetical protein